MAREYERRATSRQPIEPNRSPSQANPSQPISSGGAGGKLNQFASVVESVAPGFKRMAKIDEAEDEAIADSKAEAKLVSEDIANATPKELEQAASRYEDPNFVETFKDKGYELIGDNYAQKIQKEIAEKSANQEDFDPDQYWQDRMGEILEDVPAGRRGIVAQKLGQSHGVWRKKRREQAIENTNAEAQSRLLSSMDNKVDTVIEAGGKPNKQTLEDAVADAEELNQDPRQAKGMYLETVGQRAIEKGNPALLDGLSHLKNDPEYADTYERMRSKAQNEADKRVSVEETETRARFRELTLNGEFGMGHVREIAQNPRLREMYSEEQLSNMLLQAQGNRKKEDESSRLASRWLSKPTETTGTAAAEKSNDELSDMFGRGLQNLQEYYSDDQDKAFKLWAQKLAQSGSKGVYEPLRQRLIAQGSAVEVNSTDGEVPEAFMEGYNQFRMLAEDVPGGNDLIARHLDGSEASLARRRYEVFHDAKKSGHTTQSAYDMVRRMDRDAVPLDEFKTTESYQDLRDSLDNLEFTEYSGEAKAKVKKMAEDYGRYGLSPSKAIKLAEERFNRNHSSVRGSPFFHGGNPEYAREAQESINWFLNEDNNKILEGFGGIPLSTRVREQAGDPDLSMEEVTIRQGEDNPGVVRLYYGHEDLGIPLEVDELNRLHRQIQTTREYRNATQGHPYDSEHELPTNEGHPMYRDVQDERRSRYSDDELERMDQERLRNREEDVEQYRAFEEKVGEIFSQFDNPPNYDDAPGTPPMNQSD